MDESGEPIASEVYAAFADAQDGLSTPLSEALGDGPQLMLSISPAAVLLLCSAAGHEERIIALDDRTPGERVVCALKPLAKITGRLIAAEDGAPIAGATVAEPSLLEISGRSRSPLAIEHLARSRVAVSDLAGRYACTVPRGQTISVWARAEGYALGRVGELTVAGESQEVGTTELAPGGSLEVRVALPDLLDLERYQVALDPADAPPAERRTPRQPEDYLRRDLAADGTARWEHLAAGLYLVQLLETFGERLIPQGIARVEVGAPRWFDAGVADLDLQVHVELERRLPAGWELQLQGAGETVRLPLPGSDELALAARLTLPGTYLVALTHPTAGQWAGIGSFRVDPERGTKDLKLAPRLSRLEGTVVDSAGAPQASAEVVVQSRSGGTLCQATTDAAGSFGCSALPHGSYVAIARSEGVGIAEPIPLRISGERHQLTLFIAPGRRLTGTVSTPYGPGARGFAVWSAPELNRWSISTHIDDNGFFELREVPHIAGVLAVKGRANWGELAPALRALDDLTEGFLGTLEQRPGGSLLVPGSLLAGGAMDDRWWLGGLAVPGALQNGMTVTRLSPKTGSGAAIHALLPGRWEIEWLDLLTAESLGRSEPFEIRPGETTILETIRPRR